MDSQQQPMCSGRPWTMLRASWSRPAICSCQSMAP